jgi:hypothetical protein
MKMDPKLDKQFKLQNFLYVSFNVDDDKELSFSICVQKQLHPAYLYDG